MIKTALVSFQPSITIGVSSILLLFGITSFSLWDEAISSPGIDFYQYSGIGKVQIYSGSAAGIPYERPRHYTEGIRLIGRAHSNEALMHAQTSRILVDLTGTPFLYYSLSPLPDDYTHALFLFRIAEALCLVFAITIIAVFVKQVMLAIPMSLALVIGYDPFLLDVNVANINAMQLVILAGACAFISSFHTDHRRIFSSLTFPR